MAKWDQDAPVSRWESDTPVGPSVVRQGMASLAKGVLETADIVPRGVAGLYNTMLRVGNPLGLPEWQGTPFQSFAGLGEIGTRQPQHPSEAAVETPMRIIGGSVLPAAAVAGRARAMGQAVLPLMGVETGAAGGAATGSVVGREVGGPTGELVGTIAGGFAPAAAPYFARGIVSPMGQMQIPERVAASRRQNVPITAGQAAGGSFLEKASATLPGGQRQAAQFAENQAQQMGQRVDELTGYLTPREASQEAAGRAISRGVQGWTDAFRARAGELYNGLHALIPADTSVTLSRTRDRLENLIMDERFSQILDAPLVRNLSKALEEGETVTYAVAQGIRSRIGQKLASPDLIADAPRGQLKQIYGALTSDLDDVAKAAGPMAEQASARANAYWRGGMQRIDAFLDPIVKPGVPEKVYKAAMSGTKEGASRIRALKKSLGPEQWNVVIGTVLRRLGRARPSERTAGDITEEATDFNPETFLTNLEQLDAKARQALFSGSRYRVLEANLNDLRTLAQGIREQRQAVFNPSGTTASWYNAAGLAAPLATSAVDPVLGGQMALGIGANMALQRALQSPAMSQWLAQPRGFMPSTAGQFTRPYAALGQ